LKTDSFHKTKNKFFPLDTSMALPRGSSFIEGDDITDLSPLSGITSVIEDIIIRNNPNLTSLSDLSNINTTAASIQIINNPLLENLEGLEGFTSLIDMLIIESNDALTSLSGLNNVTSTGDLFIINNDNLEDLVGLGALIFTDGQLLIEGNDFLESLFGLANYSSGDTFSVVNNTALMSMEGVGAFETLVLSIRDNPALVDVITLDQVENIGEILEIVNNDNLTSLDGLQNLNTIGFGFTLSGNEMLTDITSLSDVLNPSMFISITDNPNLAVCDIEVVCSFISNLESFQDILISNNAAGCNSVEEVGEECLLSVNEQLLENTITIYPNPTVDILNIAFTDGVQLEHIDIFSITGKKIQTTQSTSIDFSSLTKGVYFARIQTNQGTVIKKIVKK
jgi:hypothetical protein